MKTFLISSALSLALFAHGAPAVLFEEVEVKDVSEGHKNSKKRPQETQITPLSQRSSLRNIYEGQEFGSTFDLRTRRRVGLGGMTSGATGLLGAFIELNLTPSESALIGFGGGPQYRAIHFQWKHIFGGQSFSPYAGIGYARWYNASGGEPIKNTTPSSLESRFLNEREKQSGQFEVNLLTPNLGIQYNFLSGDYTGLGIFGEVALLTELSDLSPAPTGALGVLYYF